jgi:hypothetical protein
VINTLAYCSANLIMPIEAFIIQIKAYPAMRNVKQLEGNKLAAVLGTAEICQRFYSAAKNVTINNILSHF